MSLKNFKLKQNQYIIPGEEKLHKAYNFSNSNESVDLLFAVDGGSTQTRVSVVEAYGEGADELYIIPSNMVALDDDREIKPKSDNLYDRLDSRIINQSKKTQSKIQRERIVRTTKLIDSGLSPTSISSTMQKIDEKIFYVNIIDSIGYALMQKYEDSIPKRVRCAVGVALPPDDMESTRNVDKFRDNLLGDYKFMHPDSNVEITIEILDVSVETEPGAFVSAYYATTEEEIPEKVLCINTGGRSIGAAVLQNGKLNDTASQTFPYGGNQYLAEIGKTFSNNYGGRAPSLSFLAAAVQTGNLKNGNSSIDISKEIEASAKIFADRIFNDVVKNVCDRSGINLQDLNVVIVSGGMIRRGEHGISIADFLAQKFEEVTPYTDFTCVEDNLIPLGVAYKVYTDHSDLVDYEYVEEEEVITTGEEF